MMAILRCHLLWYLRDELGLSWPFDGRRRALVLPRARSPAALIRPNIPVS
jgi:hypothetical protein